LVEKEVRKGFASSVLLRVTVAPLVGPFLDNEAVSDGFNMKKPPARTLLLQIDLSKAFDMVNHEKLLRDLDSTTLPESTKRWFSCYLHGRQSRVNFRNKTSSARNVRTGVPQGAVTSPILFNFYLLNLPTPPSGVKLIQYADDISVYMSGTDIEMMSATLTEYAASLVAFLTDRDLLVSAEKSTVTLFTPDTNEYKIVPLVKVDNTPVRLERTPKLLGVLYDTMYNFSHHIKETVKKGRSKVNVLKALAGSSWGQDKETLTITYKSIVRSTLEYAAPVWAPIISKTSWNDLQKVQNQALRVATGCYLKSNVDHLHQETKVLPLQEHSTMITKQFLAASFLPAHPGYKHLDKPPPARSRRPCSRMHKDEVSSKYQAGMSYKQTIKSIHTDTVQQCLDKYKPNKVLNSKPPEINKEELTLSRRERAELARLRSGYSQRLNSYNSIIDNKVQNRCPQCSVTPHDTYHLFNCGENPTLLNVIDLWTRPAMVAKFLKLEDEV